MAANNDSAGVIAATIAKRVATGVAGMVVIDQLRQQAHDTANAIFRGQDFRWTGDALPAPSMTPSEDAAWREKVEADNRVIEQRLNAAIAEAKRRGVPLHKIIPVH